MGETPKEDVLARLLVCRPRDPRVTSWLEADAAVEIIRLRSKLEATQARLARIEALATEPLIDSLGGYMQRLVSIRIELGVRPDVTVSPTQQTGGGDA
jgi:hypothetical protein